MIAELKSVRDNWSSIAETRTVWRPVPLVDLRSCRPTGKTHTVVGSSVVMAQSLRRTA